MTTTKFIKRALSREEQKERKLYKEQEKIFSAGETLHQQGLRRIFANAVKLLDKRGTQYDSRLFHAGRVLALLEEKQLFENFLTSPDLLDIERLNEDADVKLKLIPSPLERRNIIVRAVELLDGEIQLFGLSEIFDDRDFLGDLRNPVIDPKTGRYPGIHHAQRTASYRSIEKTLKWDDDRFFHTHEERWYIVDEDAAHKVVVKVPGIGEVTAYFDSVEYARLLTGRTQLDNAKYLAEIYRRKEDAATVSPYPQSPRIKYGLTGFPEL